MSLKKQARQIIKTGLDAVEVKGAVKKAKLPSLEKFENVYVVGFGKASAAMAEALEQKVGTQIRDGVVVSIRKAKTTCIKSFKGTHPIPSAANLKATEQIIKVTEKAGKKDLIIALISGGGSALLAKPAQGITLSEMQKVSSLLIRSKADITEINTVRKHLSQVKGGQLAKKIAPAKLHALIVSDVIKDDLSIIASGPTVGDKTTLRDAVGLLRRHGLWDKIPKSVRKHLGGKSSETPKTVRNCSNNIILNNKIALKAMHKKAKALGFKSLIYSSEVEGEAEHVGRFLMRKALALKGKGKKPIALIAGGETTVTITGKGKGGRNQEMVLGALGELQYAGNAVFISIGSDGIDGKSNAAGAIADSSTLQTARKKKLNPAKFLARNDSNSFFKKVKGEIVTGYTETNVMDLHIILIK
tara:strand:+ start:4154 stop:5398 length:1245 start_codon:yes stop_codon:yes gene_type:complete